MGIKYFYLIWWKYSWVWLQDLEVVILPGEGEPAVGGEHLVPLVHVNDLS